MKRKKSNASIESSLFAVELERLTTVRTEELWQERYDGQTQRARKDLFILLDSVGTQVAHSHPSTPGRPGNRDERWNQPGPTSESCLPPHSSHTTSNSSVLTSTMSCYSRCGPTKTRLLSPVRLKSANPTLVAGVTRLPLVLILFEATGDMRQWHHQRTEHIVDPATRCSSLLEYQGNCS